MKVIFETDDPEEIKRYAKCDDITNALFTFGEWLQSMKHTEGRKPNLARVKVEFEDILANRNIVFEDIWM